MKLTFPGTRGVIDTKNQHHRMHSSLLAGYMEYHQKAPGTDENPEI